MKSFSLFMFIGLVLSWFTFFVGKSYGLDFGLMTGITSVFVWLGLAPYLASMKN